MSTKEFLFNDFKEYMYYIRSLDSIQKTIIYANLPRKERNKISESFLEGYWDDVLCKDMLNNFVEDVKNKYGYDLLNIRKKVKNGESVYLNRMHWEYIIYNLSQYSTRQVKYLLEGIKYIICEKNENVVLLTND
ncbi:MAG: hypothetical protein ACOCRX_04850 [Candidatus Woesearchaeota archaeon]